MAKMTHIRNLQKGAWELQIKSELLKLFCT